MLFNPKDAHSHSKELTNWECNGPQYSKWGKKNWLLSMKLSLITQNSIPIYAQACPFKGNLPPGYGLMHQFTVQQVGKRGKCDHYRRSYHSSHKTQSWRCTNMFILRNLPTESATVHSGERRKNWDCYPWSLSLITQNPILMYAQACPFKATYPLSMG